MFLLIGVIIAINALIWIRQYRRVLTNGVRVKGLVVGKKRAFRYGQLMNVAIVEFKTNKGELLRGDYPVKTIFSLLDVGDEVDVAYVETAPTKLYAANKASKMLPICMFVIGIFLIGWSFWRLFES